MAGQVEQHQATPVSVPVSGDALTASVVRTTQNATIEQYNAHDADATIHFLSGTLAQRPPAGTPGRKFVTTDSPRVIYLDTGSGWVVLDYQTGLTVPDQYFYLFATRI